MRPFSYEKVTNEQQALERARLGNATFVAGGTTLVDLMKLNVEVPAALVDINGLPSNIRVVRAIGLGLDERAVQAVEKWKFRPAMSGDRPVIAPAVVEVSFHLL